MIGSIESIKELGFTGFETVESLWNDSSNIPNERGVYLVLNSECSNTQFLEKGAGGFFKGKDPNLALHELSQNWVNNSQLMYIGQAGGNNSSATLKKRIRQYLQFGQGKPVGHYGGRLIWQLSNHKDLIIAWKVSVNSNPREDERLLLNDFFNYHGKLPFANLVF